MRLLGSAFVVTSLLLGAGGIALRVPGDARASEDSTPTVAPAPGAQQENAVCQAPEAAPLTLDLSRVADPGGDVVPLNTRGYNYRRGPVDQPPMPERKHVPPASPEQPLE
jgi:hypothetical protein